MTVIATQASHPLRRVGLVVAMAVVSINIWTGSPLVALWIGSQVQGSGPPTMTAVFVVVLVFATLSLALTKLLALLDAAYQGGGTGRKVRHHVAWLRSMRGERAHYPGDSAPLTALERVLIVVVVVAVVLLEIWFFFFAGSPLASNAGTPSS